LVYNNNIRKGVHVLLRFFVSFFIVSSLSLEANYCIQVLSTTKDGKDAIVGEASSSKYLNFEDVRVEKRGNYLVFRIGDYSTYSGAESDLKRVKNISKKAFVRKCDFIKSKSVYIQKNHNNKRLKYKVKAPKKYTPKKKIKTEYRSSNKFGIDETLLP